MNVLMRARSSLALLFALGLLVTLPAWAEDQPAPRAEKRLIQPDTPDDAPRVDLERSEPDEPLGELGDNIIEGGPGGELIDHSIGKSSGSVSMSPMTPAAPELEMGTPRATRLKNGAGNIQVNEPFDWQGGALGTGGSDKLKSRAKRARQEDSDPLTVNTVADAVGAAPFTGDGGSATLAIPLNPKDGTLKRGVQPPAQGLDMGTPKAGLLENGAGKFAIDIEGAKPASVNVESITIEDLKIDKRPMTQTEEPAPEVRRTGLKHGVLELPPHDTPRNNSKLSAYPIPRFEPHKPLESLKPWSTPIKPAMTAEPMPKVRHLGLKHGVLKLPPRDASGDVKIEKPFVWSGGTLPVKPAAPKVTGEPMLKVRSPGIRTPVVFQPRVGAAKGIVPNVAAPKILPPKITVPKVVTPKVVTPKVIAPKVIAPKVIAPKVVTPKVVTPKVVAPKVVAPKVVAPKVVAPKVVPPKL